MQTEYRRYVKSFTKQGLVPMTFEYWLDETHKKWPKKMRNPYRRAGMTNASIFIYCTHPEVTKDWGHRFCSLCVQKWDSSLTEPPKAIIGFVDVQELKKALEGL